MKLGYEVKTGNVVDVPVTHAVISALTGGGKTEAILRLMKEAEAAGYTILALDVKAKPRDFEGAGREIRPIIRESTEPLLVLRMLEAVAGASLFSKFSTLLDACMDTKNLQEVKQNLDAIYTNKKAWVRKRDDAKVLSYLLGKLLDQIKEGDYAGELQLGPGINVMNISNLPQGVQQLVVDSVFRRLLVGKWKRVILILEEAINFIPQAEATQFETSARKFIREGRSAELFLWASGQALTEMDIHIRKQMRVWILGPQMEENEAKKFMRQVPMKGVEPHEIQKLPTGHFICALRRAEEQGGQVDVMRVYAQPTWLPDNIALSIATGKMTLKDAMKHKKLRVVVHTEDEERKKYEAKIRELETLLSTSGSSIKDLTAQVHILAGQRDDAYRDLRKQGGTKVLEEQLAGTLGLSGVGTNVRPGVAQTPQTPIMHEMKFNRNDLDDVAKRVSAMLDIPSIVRREMQKVGPTGIREVPPPRAILQGLLAEALARTKSQIGALSYRQKKALAYLAAKGVGIRLTPLEDALFGGHSGDYNKELRALAETGLAKWDANNFRLRYVGREYVKGMASTYDLSEGDVEEVLGAIENEFAHLVVDAKEE